MSRWMLNRAGITNVYQYGDVTIPFLDGRLLLRGVNGSGKSTAMNMLLPFLLEADVRRIDAAGEQTAVLRSWMLAGREDAQPAGYLWLELRRSENHAKDHAGDHADEYLVFGCGIRANRSTDRVTTWWFITDRRPGMELSLVAARTPITVDALRAEIGPASVYSHDQRATYRADLQRRLYGTTALDQHLRLLHIVRNPRVGDRIDQDLPAYLTDALPQLSEPALDDAAGPLDDLDEHRRNVENLHRTASTLAALDATYRDYAGSELRRRVTDAHTLTADSRRLAQTATRLIADRNNVEQSLGTTEEAVRGHDSDIAQLDGEAEALRASEAYRAGIELHERREQVRMAESAATTARQHFDAAAKRAVTAHTALRRAMAEATEDHRRLSERLNELSTLAATCRIIVALPDLPAIATQDGQSELAAPIGELNPGSFATTVATVRSAAKVRREEVREVVALLGAVQTAEASLHRVVEALERARTEELHARARAEDARRIRDDQAAQLHQELTMWVADLIEHATVHGLVGVHGVVIDATVPTAAALLVNSDVITATHRRAIDAVLDEHGNRVAVLAAQLQERITERTVAAAALAALLAVDVPEVPVVPWQVPVDGLRFAELVDFAADLDEQDRAGLEAALEAAQLLSAELDPAAGLLVEGRLIVRPGMAVARSLADVLVVALPDGADPALAQAATAVLATISTDPADLDADGDCTVVTVDGRFRTGVARGRHTKLSAEHLGITARRRGLQRRRAEAATALEEAGAAVLEAETDHARAEVARTAARALRDELADPAALQLAVVAFAGTSEQLDLAVERTADHTERYSLAEESLADATALLDRRAASSGLPRDHDGLARLDQDLRDAGAACDRAADSFATLVRAVRAWMESAEVDRDTRADEGRARAEHGAAVTERQDRAMRLATLEDAIGLEHAEVAATLDLCIEARAVAVAALETARRTQGELRERLGSLRADAERAGQDRDRAEGQCAVAVDLLRAVLNVPGLLDALTDPTPTAAATAADPARPTTAATATAATAAVSGYVEPNDPGEPPENVPIPFSIATTERSGRGLRALADALMAFLPSTDRFTSAESVRQSLRQRRDTLGAGWDAEDRQPDPTRPLHVEVTGPLGQMPLRAALVEVRNQLRRAERLLSAQQDQALRNLLQGLIAREVAEKLQAARDLTARMNVRLDTIRTTHGIGVSLRWRPKDDLDPATVTLLALLARPADLRTAEEDRELVSALAERITGARAEAPEMPYRQLIGAVLDYRQWHQMIVLLHRAEQKPERLSRRTALSEGEKKMVSYLPLFAAVAASCDALADGAPDAPRFVLLDDAFAKVSEDNHAKLFGLLVDLDLDFIATSERLWGTHDTVPSLAICEVIRDAALGVIMLQHAEWDGCTLTLRGHGHG